MRGTPGPQITSTKLCRIAELARIHSEEALTNLAKHIDVDFLREAFRRTRKDGAPGVDGQSASEYAENLEENLQRLLNCAKSGAYRAPPVRRVYIPKGSGDQTRPIGIPTFEDKVLQRAVAMVLDAVYEQEFLDCSYGFRPKRSAHQALEVLWEGTMKMGGGWVVELDIKSFFDVVEHSRIREFVQLRVQDGVLLRLIGKWLKAGVMEDESITCPDQGTPQGGVVSPILANVYLHHVLDLWWQNEILPRTRGRAFMIRFADDAVMVFQHRSEAERFMEVLPKRFGRFGLELHPEKTRLVRFSRPARDKEEARKHPKAGTFDFLGFTHYWGRSHKGRPVVKRKTAKGRLARALGSVKTWLRKHRHLPVAWQHRALCGKMRGHYAYYGITNNFSSLASFVRGVTHLWVKWLGRRGHPMSYERYNRLLRRYPLPPARVVHGYR